MSIDGPHRVNRLLSDIEDGLREGMSSFESLGTWVDKYGNIDQREHHRSRQWGLDQGARALRELRGYTDQIKGRPFEVVYIGAEPEPEQRCRCQDPGAMPPCSYCTDGPGVQAGDIQHWVTPVIGWLRHGPIDTDSRRKAAIRRLVQAIQVLSPDFDEGDEIRSDE